MLVDIVFLLAGLARSLCLFLAWLRQISLPLCLAGFASALMYLVGDPQL